MRIGINAKYAFDKKVRGIGKYTLKLIQNLARIDTNNFYILYVDKVYSNNDIFNNLPDNFKIKQVKESNYLLFEQVKLPKYIKKDSLDVFHATGNTFPVLTDSNLKMIVTIHDVMFLKNEDIIPQPQTFYQKLGKYYRKYNLKFKSKIDKVITVSDFSKYDVHQETNIDLSKIKVTRLGFEKKFLNYEISQKEIEKGKEKFGIKDQFFYHLGGDATNKNTEQVIKVYSKLPSHIKVKYQLVITGIKHDLEDWKRKLKDYGLNNERVIFTGYVTDDELKFLYDQAELFLFLSLYEGFGIPILEAMGSKTPVIASNRSVIPEIVGDGGKIVNPNNETEVVNAICNILKSQELYCKIINKGVKNLNRFSWLELAKLTLKQYKEVYQK
ncbi:glycosyltransferase [Halobacteroides halobius DSM 5150]|uniref:Glycosyltransferase n=1 Tax=Halobacteroides halobius (strain ATCC 35273 / DSM 5150 / MD-1) TaxID=748449 RepID=L0KB64_HALHC|nr:glycosyltransferase family 1 protein [Halobacteroides halobius]AGB42256.1 glycosyltransferase [Halobacteroides halobius DSM 5150]